MKKIIQIQADHGLLYALAEDGKLYMRAKATHNKANKNKGTITCYERSFWKEIRPEEKNKTTSSDNLPF